MAAMSSRWGAGGFPVSALLSILLQLPVCPHSTHAVDRRLGLCCCCCHLAHVLVV
jgi:hypothetical protein